MKTLYAFLILFVCCWSCGQPEVTTVRTSSNDFTKLLDNYYEDRLKLYPIEATMAGDNRYNNLLSNDGSTSFIAQSYDLYTRYLNELKATKREELDTEGQLSYDILFYQLNIRLEGFQYKMYYDLYNFAHLQYNPFNQMIGIPLLIGQMGSGTSVQPFKTSQDYDNWIKRLQAFQNWSDTAIANMNKGIASGYVLPASLVQKLIPQMESMVVTNPEKSLFYEPVINLPAAFTGAEKKQITDVYRNAIMRVVVPTYMKLGAYLKKDYLPHARTSSGFSALPNGAALYAFAVKQNTTTDKTPEEIYQLGLNEVARIRRAMDSVKSSTGFRGDLKTFFEYMKTDKRFMPYKTPKEVLNAFDSIHRRMEPNLKTMFNHVPKTGFEIRQTEAFRAASASAEYTAGTAGGDRPGIFYVPIIDAATFNTTSGMESLFLHEAIPGHHYQISLTQENTSLPKFRRFGVDNAYVEGWALYCESLGKELGLYTDPYQLMGALGDEIHRAIRLVVDVAIHAKGMSREEAIKYMMSNEAISEQGAIAEIERYMANPGQALGYKIGALKIQELRSKSEQALGNRFNLAEFHHQILKDGSMPLSILEAKITNWIGSQK